MISRQKLNLQDKEKVVYGSRESDKEKKALIRKTSSLRMLDPVLVTLSSELVEEYGRPICHAL